MASVVADSKTIFFRKLMFEAEVDGTLRLLSLAAGWSHPVDPETGMSVSLPEVEGWLQTALRLVATRTWRSLESLLRFVQSEGLNGSRGSAAKLERVEIADDFVHEKITWQAGKILWTKTLQIQGVYQGSPRLFEVDVTGAQEFSEPEEMFPFVVQGAEELVEALEGILHLREGEWLCVRDPLRGVCWSR